MAYLHALGIRASRTGRLAAISSRSAARAGQIRMLLGVPHFTFDAHEAMFARPDVDLVVIGSPNGAHIGHARTALAAGKAILVEKPLTLTLAEAAELVAREEAGAFVGYAENHVFAPVIHALHRHVADGLIGTVVRIEGRFHNPPLAADSWHGSTDLSGGGALVNLGSHLFATYEWLLGADRIAEVSRATIRRGPGGLDDHAKVAMRTGRDVEVLWSVGFGIDPIGCSYRIVGTTGTLAAHLMPDPKTLVLHREGEGAVGLPFDEERSASLAGAFRRTGYGPQIDHFVTALATGTRPSLGAREGESAKAHCAGSPPPICAPRPADRSPGMRRSGATPRRSPT